MLLTSQNHSTDWIYHFHGPKKRAPPELGRKSRITKICVGVCQKFFPPTFLDVFLDVESDKKNRLKFWPSGAEISPFFWFWHPRYGHFFKKSKNLFSKIHEIWLILFQIFYLINPRSRFGSIWYHLRKNEPKLPKNRSNLSWSRSEMQPFLKGKWLVRFLV